MSVTYLESYRFEGEVKNSDGLAFVDFFAEWCGPCHMMAPKIEELSDECDFADFFKVDIDEATDLCAEYDIQSIPTMIIFKDGEEVERFIGVTGKSEIMNALRSYREESYL